MPLEPPTLPHHYGDHYVAWRATCQQLLRERQLFAARAGDYEGLEPNSPKALGQLAARAAVIEGQEQQKWAAGQLKGPAGLNPAMRCVRPECVEIQEGRGFVERGVGSVLDWDRVVHLKGLDQSASPYGISVLEPLLYLKVRTDLAERLDSMARSVPVAHLTEQQRYALETDQRLVKQLLEEAAARVSELLSFFSTRLEQPISRLYFPGQEQMS